jgi:hypothetical protein
MTTPRPDLSNHAIAIETGEHECKVVANVRGQLGVLFLAMVVVAITLLPIVQSRAVERWNKGQRKPSRDDLEGLALTTLPLVIAVTTFAMVFARRSQVRAVQVIEGVVTVFTPDLPVGVHRFERSNLAGAQLHTSQRGTELRIHRRSGLAIPVFSGYRARDLGPAVDVINSLVTATRYYGFEVILTKPAAADHTPDDNPL